MDGGPTLNNVSQSVKVPHNTHNTAGNNEIPVLHLSATKIIHSKFHVSPTDLKQLNQTQIRE